MSPNPSSPFSTDAQLVERCLAGDRSAFREIVERYQGLVCAQAYAICGDFGRSEDIAQEAFVSAWRQLRELRDLAKFKSWLCGIARHLALRAADRRRREDALHQRASGEPLASSTPRQKMIAREEEALVWRALQELPEGYRTTLTLYYREGQQVSEVAELLELSEDAVKQRLSRGRALLREQVAASIESALRRTRPGPAFTLAVLMAVPAVVPTSAKAAAFLAAAKGAAPANAVGAFSTIFAAFCGTAVGFLGGWLGIKVSAESARYDRERSALLRGGRIVTLGAAVFLAVVFALSLNMQGLSRLHPAAFPVALILATFGYAGWLFYTLFRAQREVVRICREEEAADAPVRQPHGVWSSLAIQRRADFKSRASFLGWPLVHVRFVDDLTQSPVRAWLAVGSRSVGAIAVGRYARGFLAMGGIAVGVVAFGGAALGLISVGGCALALLAYGGVAVGWISSGGCAVAWRFALGGFSFAHHDALGGFASAAHANSPQAEAFATHCLWIQMISHKWFPFVIPAVVTLQLLLITYFSRKLPQSPSEGAPH